MFCRLVRRFVCTALMALALTGAVRGEGGFKPGHLYVAVREPEACFQPGYREAILEVDPATGNWRVFADDLDDGLCVVGGLRFTPDGKQLLALNFGHFRFTVDYGWIQAFHPDGTSEILYDASDGLSQPSGANGLAFDANGNLYVANSNSTILRFPAGGRAGSVFSDAADGIVGGGALDFAPNGDLFYCGRASDFILRILPSGAASVFDEPPPDPWSLVFDRHGNLFASSGGDIYRYDNNDPASRRLLAGFSLGSPTLAISRDGITLFGADWANGLIYTIDPLLGSTAVVADVSSWSARARLARGLALYPPPIAGDQDADGDLDLRDFATFELCESLQLEFEPPDTCRSEFDMDKDGDVDLSDVGRFVSAMTGPQHAK